MSDSMKEVVESLDPVSRRLVPDKIRAGNLIPLKTTLELRDNLCVGLAYITRVPTRLTNEVVNVVRALVGDDMAKNLPHLRRCSKPSDLPPHLKTTLMNEGENTRKLHVGKSAHLYIMLGPKNEMNYEELLRGLSSIEGIRDDLFIGLIPVPLLAPTSQVQANLWSQQYWQTVYRKNNPLGPHPSSICRTTTALSRDADIWMALAHQIAQKAYEEGLGEPIGAVIVKRTTPAKPNDQAQSNRPKGKKNGVEKTDTADGEKVDGDTVEDDVAYGEGADGDMVDEDTTDAVHREFDQIDPLATTATAVGTPHDAAAEPQANIYGEAAGSPATAPIPEVEEKEKVEIVAIAGDARWYRQEKTGRTGNPMAHAALRAISMVAQKLVKAENREPSASKPILEFEAFQDRPLLREEQMVFEMGHPVPDGYLCHDLELYMTHEPCIMCAMAILHSRMGRIIFRTRMPLTGGMGSEDRTVNLCGVHSPCDKDNCGGGKGIGLHWRRELNWSMLGWEWDSDHDHTDRLIVDPHMHA